MAAPNKRPWIWSAVGIASLSFLLHQVVDWHHEASRTDRAIRYTTTRSRFLLDDTPDDVTRDEMCRKYIWNFLNGTTDVHDECDGFYNAFQAAGCKNDSQIAPLWGLQNETDDTPIISNDDYTSWECCESIEDYYEKNCEDVGLDSGRLLGIVTVLVICGFMRSIIRTVGVMKWVPNAGVCVLVGAISGGLLRLFSSDVVQNRFAFDNDLFLQIMLPPIIFAAAMTIDKQAFRRDLFPILMFAVIGTGLSAVAIGLVTFHLSSLFMGPSLPLLDSLLFGALMSSIDPVATLGILSSVGVSQSDTLFTLIFGESLLNDGVSIVLFDSLVQHMGDADVVDAATAHATLVDFFRVTAGSCAIGLACGALCTLYFWILQDKQTPVAEVGLFFAWALIPYYVADGVGMSGIISILVMGLVMDFFVIGGNQSDESEWMEYMQMRHHSDEHHPEQATIHRIKAAMGRAFSGCGHIHDKSRRHVGFVAEVISSLMETAIFAYLGLFLFNEQDWNIMLMLGGIVACMSSRAGMVLCLSLLINIGVWLDLEGMLGRLWYIVTGRQQPSRAPIRLDDDSIYSDSKKYLDRRTQLILFSAGVRGAVSYALVQNIPVYNSVTKHGSHFKGELKAMTSATIVVLLFLFGAITYYTVQHDWSTSHDRAAGPLTRRLMSNALVSDDGMAESAEDEQEEIRFFPENRLEIEGRPAAVDVSTQREWNATHVGHT